MVVHRKLLIGLAVFCALSAIGGGAWLLGVSRGNDVLPIELLGTTPFATFVVPGLLLIVGVGATSLAAAALLWRRSPFALDAALLAGGTLTVWIVAEVALFRGFHWLQALYGAAGLALLSVAIWDAWRGQLYRHRWLIIVTAAEALGFLCPTLMGVWSHQAGVSEAGQVALMTVAGLGEGFLLGLGQSVAFRLPVRRARYTLLTAVGAGLVWCAVMSTMLLAAADVPVAATAGAAVLVALFGLLGIGGPQYLELRHHTTAALRWIPWTALAWVVALPTSFLPGLLVDETTPVWVDVTLYACAGLLMAYLMALITWQGARSLTAPTTPDQH